MRLAPMALTALLMSALACGSSSESRQARQPAAEASPPPTAETKLAAAQEHAIEAMCERLVDCSVEDARATMSPEELANLKPEELVPRARADCEAEYGQQSFSPRQIKIVQRCVNEAIECPALAACLEEASSG